MLIGYPRLGRYGLGHSLIAWARCVVWCELTQTPMLAPIWLKPRLGPYLRRERDKREYFKLFNNKGAIKEPARSWHLLTGRKYLPVDGYFEEDIFAASFLGKHRASAEKTIVCFENSPSNNTEKHFAPVLPHAALVHRRLLQMVRPRYLPAAKMAPFIAVHIRLGDFAPPKDEKHSANHSVRRPVSWYRDTLIAVRAALGGDLRAIIYSDGHDDEISDVLQLAGTVRAPRRESVTDMLEMAKAEVIIGSSSGFAFWAAFLGQVPRVNYPGTLMTRALNEEGLETEYEGEGPLPPRFLQKLAGRLT